MSNAWSHLPNAHHIDWVLASLNENSELWVAVRDAVRDAVLGSSMVVTRDAAWDAILSLIVYDDCDQFLSMPYERLKVWAVLSEDPRAVLLLQMVYVRERLRPLKHEYATQIF